MKRIDEEVRTVGRMIGIYCRAHHGSGRGELCDECRVLLAYAEGRLGRCVHGEGKPSCRKCMVHCYAASRREAIREVMRYAGPRMLWHYPLDALRHMLRELL